jgi:DNA-binding NarL/FixJ family response regulator
VQPAMSAGEALDAAVRALIAAIGSVPAAVAVFDASGELVGENAAARALSEGTLGASLAADLGSGAHVFHLDGRPYEPAELPVTRSLGAGEQVAGEECLHRGPGGVRMAIRCSCAPVRADDGAVVAAVLSMVDVTEDERRRDRLATLEPVLVDEEDGDDAQSVRVLLVEGHAAFREAIAAMLEREPGFTVVGQAGSLAEARGMLDGVDVALLDLGLPDGFGPDLIRELRARSPRAEALVLSAAALDRSTLARAVDSGAAGAIDKLAHLDEVVNAVRQLRAGETLLTIDEVNDLVGHERRRRAQEAQDRDTIARLTPREREVLQALAEGLDSQAVADRLHIELRTERNHVANILGKLGVHSQLQALVWCVRYGVVEIH